MPDETIEIVHQRKKRLFKVKVIRRIRFLSESFVVIRRPPKWEPPFSLTHERTGAMVLASDTAGAVLVGLEILRDKGKRQITVAIRKALRSRVRLLRGRDARENAL
jgi:hypothetical protein